MREITHAFAMDRDLSKSPSPTKSRFRSLLRGLRIVVLSMALVLGGFALFIRVTLTGDGLAKLVIPPLERACQARITYSSASLTWLSLDSFKWSIIGMELHQGAQGGILLRVPQTVLEVKLLPLFKGTLLIHRLSINKPTLFLHSVGEPKRAQAAASLFKPAMARFLVRPVISSFEASSADVRVGQSDSRGATPVRVLQGISIVGKELTVSSAKALSVRGRVAEEAEPGRLLVDYESSDESSSPTHILEATLARCPVAALRVVAASLGYEIPLSGGVADIGLTMRGFPRNYRMKVEARLARTTLVPGKLFLKAAIIEKAGLKLQAEILDDDLRLDVQGISLPGLNMSGECLAKGISRGGDSELTVALKTADIDLDTVFPFIPLNLLSPQDRESLQRAGLSGHITVTKGIWKGRTEYLVDAQPHQGAVVLNAFLEQVSGFVPGLALPVKDASGEIRLNEHELLLKDIRFTLATSPIVLKGSITDLISRPQVDLFISLKAEAQDLQPLLTNRLIARRLPQWMQWIENPKGWISLELTANGPLDWPSLKGSATFDHIQCNVPRWSLPIKDLKGSLTLAGGTTTISNVTASLGDTTVAVDGNLVEGRIQLATEAKVAPRDLARLKLLPSSVKVSGKAPLTLKLEGKPDALNFQAALDLKGNSLGIGWVMSKTAGVPLTIRVSGIKQPHGLTIKEGSLQSGNGRIDAGGTYYTSGKLVLAVNLPKQGLLTKDLVPIAHRVLDLQPGGRIEGTLKVTAGPDWSESPNVDADLKLYHVSLQLFGFHKPSSGITGTVRWKGSHFDANVETMKIGSSQFSGKCTIQGFREPTVDVVLECPFFDTTDFEAPPGFVSRTTWGEWIRTKGSIRFLARSKGSAVLTAAKIKTRQHVFTGFEAKVSGKDGLLRLPEWKIAFADGTIRGRALFDIRANTDTPLRIDFLGDHLKMERILVGDPAHLSASGNMWINGQLEWHLSDRRENKGIFRTGTMEIRVHDGAIHRFEILSKIFSLINFGSILRGRFPDVIAKGLPFRRLHWKMDVMDAKWNVHELQLDSDAAGITAVGLYLSDQSKVDFKVNVSPLVGLDTLLTGLFGKLLPRDGKTVTATFLVRGPAESPDVRLVPFEPLKGQR